MISISRTLYKMVRSLVLLLSIPFRYGTRTCLGIADSSSPIYGILYCYGAIVFCHSFVKRQIMTYLHTESHTILHKIRRGIIITFATLNYTFHGKHFNLIIPFLVLLFLIMTVCSTWTLRMLKMDCRLHSVHRTEIGEAKKKRCQMECFAHWKHDEVLVIFCNHCERNRGKTEIVDCQFGVVSGRNIYRVFAYMRVIYWLVLPKLNDVTWFNINRLRFRQNVCQTVTFITTMIPEHLCFIYP